MISGGLKNKKPVCALIVALGFWIGVSVFRAAPVYADSPALVISADQQIGLGDHFFSSGEYDRAVTAYQTVLYFFPDSDRAEYVQFQIARAFFEKGDIEAALERFENLHAKSKDTQFGTDAGFMAGRCHVAMGRRSMALSILTRLAENSDNPAIHERVFYETAWSYLETAPVLAEEDLAAAMESFQRISPPGQERLHVGQMLKALEQARDDDGGLLASMKRPGLAGAMAVVPGAGYLYCGRYQDALISFLFNGAMILAAWEAFDEDQEALGAVLSMVELGFYGGNIYGSVSAAHKYNRQRTGVFMKGLRSIGAGFVPAGDGVGVKVSFRQPF